MKHILKITGITLGILIALAIIIFSCLVAFVSPNRFKPLITEQVKKYTGRQLTIDGDLSWTLFPYLGVKVGHLQISNPAGFKEPIFAEIKDATVGVKILPLMHAKVESSGISLRGMKINLIKNADGKTNWQDLQNLKTTSKVKISDEQPTETTIKPKNVALGLAISGIDISDATVTWTNEQAKQSMEINHFELHAKDLSLTNPFALASSFDFNDNAGMSGNVSLTSQISLDPNVQMYIFDDLNLTTKINQGTKKIDMKVTDKMIADLSKNTLMIDNLVAEIGDLKATGRINVANLTTNPKTTGHLQIAPVDVKKWLQSTGQEVTALQTCKDLSGDFDFTAGTSLKSLNLTGNVKIDEVIASNVHITKMDSPIKMQNSVLELSPFTANFYQGTVDGQMKVNLTTSTPQISLQTKVANVQTEALLADLAAKSKLKLSGVGNVDFQVTTSGTSNETIIKNLNGTAHLSLNDGTLKGIDIAYLIDSAYSLATTRQGSSESNTDQTSFGSLTASATITNGIVTNNDLLLSAPRFETKGEGTINLLSQQVNYHLNTTVKQNADQQNNNLKNLYGTAIPIAIKGDLSNPSIRLDAQSLMNAVAEQQIQKAKSEVQQKLQDKIHGAAGSIINNLLGH